MADESESGSSGPQDFDKPLPTDGENIVSGVGRAGKEAAESVVNPTGKDGVFTAVAKTFTGKNAYESDKVEHAYKLLTSSMMANTSALPSLIPGSRQEIIRGNSVLQVTGQRYMSIDGNDTQIIKGIQNEQTIGDAKFAYKTNRYLAVGQNEERLIYQQQNTFVLGPSTEQYIGKHEVTAPEEFEWKQLERGFSGIKLDMAMFGLDIHSTAADVHVVDAELAVFEGKSKVLSEKAKAQEGEAVALIAIISMELDVQVRADVLIDVGLGTPFR